MKFAFIEEHLTDFPVEISCFVLEVSRSGYYDWICRPRSERDKRREELTAKIKIAVLEGRGVYGSPRIFKALAAQGESVCENTVAKVMKAAGIRAKTKKTFVPRTTDSNHQHQVAGNVLDRQFSTEFPNQKWAADITYRTAWPFYSHAGNHTPLPPPHNHKVGHAHGLKNSRTGESTSGSGG